MVEVRGVKGCIAHAKAQRRKDFQVPFATLRLGVRINSIQVPFLLQKQIPQQLVLREV
jgi:hypothetical protein